MSNGNIDKLYKKTVKPSIGEENSLYFIGDESSEFVDFYVTDRKGKLIPVVNELRTSFNSSINQLKILRYFSDIKTSDEYYYYGYEYSDNSIKIIRVKKDEILNQKQAQNLSNLNTDWNNRQSLNYT